MNLPKGASVAFVTTIRTQRVSPTPSIPLTTIFTPNKDCTGDDAFKTRTVGSSVYYEFDDGAMKPTCYPLSYKSYQYYSVNWYSPGVCPLSYVYVSTSISTRGNAPEITFAACCPSNVAIISGFDSSCRSVSTSRVETVDGSVVTSSTVYYANPILVAWQESDISRFSPQSEARAALRSAGVTLPPELSTASSTTDKSATSTSNSNNRDDDEDPGSSGGGLSSGAAAGIGVAVGLVVIMLLVAPWWFMKRRKATQGVKNADESGQLWNQQIYKVPDTAETSEVIETPRNGLRG
ncbi:hypothetical protein HYE68_005361 [Fusarium pseudograminearum]|nr:hypothetical protein HYE68_005361 [Fusarium pseudograminearum]